MFSSKKIFCFVFFWVTRVDLTFEKFFRRVVSHVPNANSRSSLRVTVLVFQKKNSFHFLLFYCCFAETYTHTHTYPHPQKTFLKRILLIEFCRLNRAVTWSVRDSTPGQGNPGQFFGKYLKLHWLSNQPIRRSPARLEEPKKEGLK